MAGRRCRPAGRRRQDNGGAVWRCRVVAGAYKPSRLARHHGKKLGAVARVLIKLINWSTWEVTAWEVQAWEVTAWNGDAGWRRGQRCRQVAEYLALALGSYEHRLYGTNHPFYIHGTGTVQDSGSTLCPHGAKHELRGPQNTWGQRFRVLCLWSIRHDCPAWLRTRCQGCQRDPLLREQHDCLWVRR